MGGGNASYEKSFTEWLAKRVPSAQIPVTPSVYKGIDQFCLKRKILKKPLFETDDLGMLSNALEAIRNNKFFLFKYRKQKSTMVAVIQYYCRFIKEMQDIGSMVELENLPNEAFQNSGHEVLEGEALVDVKLEKLPNEAPQNSGQEVFQKESLVDFLAANNIEFIDNRPKNGCLWIIGGKELKEFVDKCSTRGVRFHFKADGSRAVDYSSAWWTTDDFDSAAKVGPTIPVEENVPGKENQLANTASCHLAPDEEQQGVSVAEDIIESEPKTESSLDTNVPTVSDIDALLRGNIFLPLKNALAKENIRTIEELRGLNLWAFMNQKNLYSISTRQDVLTRVRLLLEPETTEKPESLYVLRCGLIAYTGNSPAKIFLHFCEDIAKKYPLFFRSLLGKTIGNHSNVKIYRSSENGNFIGMENPICYVSADLTKDSVIAAVEWIMQRCTNEAVPISVKEPDVHLERAMYTKIPQEKLPRDPFDEQAAVSTSVTNKPEQYKFVANDTDEKQWDNGNVAQTSQVSFGSVRAISSPSTFSREEEINDSEQIVKIEKIVFDADMTGVTYDALYDTLNMTMVAIKALVQKSKHIVEIKGKLYHENTFIDWDDGAKQMCLIMEKLMQKNNGYISAVQLYDYARAEMNMFLNDNDMNDERSVYDIAQHLFGKNHYEGIHYSFVSKTHISKAEDVISSNFDVICRFAEEQGGVFQESDLTEYLKSIRIKTGNLRMQMRLGQEPKFFFYQPGTIISAKSMKIDYSWKESVGRALDKLFNDAGDHIVLRQIQSVWYESLPALPGHRCWTPLLLQYVLLFYGKEWGAKTIAAMRSQSMDTLHAMLVKTDSPIQNFGDAVIACLIESEIEQRSFEAEELRQFLVKIGMIQGNELIYNMPNALAKDERFAWDAKGENVTVRV